MMDFLQAPTSVPGIEIRLFLTVAFAGAAAYFDVFNRKWVPNSLLYAFALAAIFLNIAFFDPNISVLAFAFGLAAFLLTYPLYKTGQLGGADVFCLASISAAVPYLPSPILNPSASAPYPFILSALVPAGLLFIAHMLARFLPYIYDRIKKGKIALNFSRLAQSALIVAAFLFFAYSLSTLPVKFPFGYFAMLSFLFVSLLFFSLFKDEIKQSMVERVPVLRLQEEDVLALEQMDAALVKRLKLEPLITKKAIAALKAARQKSVPVYTGLPFFLPYLFFGVVFALLFGDLISIIVLAAGI